MRTTPLASIGALLCVALVLAALAGRALRRRARKPEDADNLIVSSVLGLLALLLGFTFAMAAERFEARRLLVQEEANAVLTTYLQAKLLDEPYRSQISNALVRYTDNHIALGKAQPGPAARTLLSEDDRLIVEFWNASAAAFPSIKNLDFSSTFIDGVNAVINLDATRKSARLARVPPAVFVVLFLYVVTTAGVLGFLTSGFRATAFAGVFLVLLAISLLLVVDIDRPALGRIRESQAPMERLRETLQRFP